MHSSLKTPTQFRESNFLKSPEKDQLQPDLSEAHELGKTFVSPKNYDKLETRPVNLNKSVLIH